MSWTDTRKQKMVVGDEPSVEHHLPINEEDLAKLESYLSDVLQINDAVKLTYYCWFNITLHFALQSSEVQLALKNQILFFETDSEGRTYANLHHDFHSKNCGGRVAWWKFETTG